MRALMYSTAALALAACSKTQAPPAPQAPPPPAPAPASTPSPNPASPPAATPQASAPTATPAAQPNGAVAPQATEATTTPAAASPSADPFDNDLRALEVAVRLRDAFVIEAGKAAFVFKIVMADGSVPVDETFILEQTHGVDSPCLQREARPGFTFCTYRLAAADEARMKAADDRFKALKAQSTGGNQLTFEASVQTRLRTDVQAPDNFSLTVYARTHPYSDFMQLADEQVIARDDPKAGTLFSA